MRCIDFDARFADYARDWVAAHEDDYASVDEMELAMPAVYQQFLDTPADWLDGERPGAYFARWDDPGLLIGWLGDYLEQGVSVPDMLLNRIAELGEPAAEVLCQLLDDDSATNEKKMLAVTLLRELDSPLPMERYVAWQYERGEEDELCDNALESLEGMGEIARAAMLEGLEGASPAGREALLGALSHLTPDERVLEGLMALLDARPRSRAVLAACLARLGDARALPRLIELAQEGSLAYLDYIELRSAIEALGGEAPEREFFDDAEYDALMGVTP